MGHRSQCRRVLPDHPRQRREDVVNHDKGGFKGGAVTIERLRLLGFRSDHIFACDLNSQEGKTALSLLTRDAQAQSLDATPLGPSSSTSRAASQSPR